MKRPVPACLAGWRGLASVAAGSVAVGGVLPGAARAAAPLTYLRAHGQRAYPINSLLWALIAISAAVVVMAIVLVLLSTFRGRAMRGDALPGKLAVEPAGGGMAWIVVGVGMSAVVLFGAAVWTVTTLAAVSNPPPGWAKLRLEIVGHQWWWEVRYFGDSAPREFRTANEIHIPVGVPVLIDLRTADVIHSFWIPALTGKTDTIPGQTNTTWLQASRPGVYRGQCTEYCGRQHAHMGLEVIADPPKAFQAWRDGQLQPAALKSAEEQRGLQTFVRKCGACHAVRGTRAGGVLGPDLSHLMSRRTIAAGTLPNTTGYLLAWISDPQHIKPGASMPRLDLSGPELVQIRQLLETLK